MRTEWKLTKKKTHKKSNLLQKEQYEEQKTYQENKNNNKKHMDFPRLSKSSKNLKKNWFLSTCDFLFFVNLLLRNKMSLTLY